MYFTVFRFTATYYPRWGYFIEAINGLHGNWKDNKTFWQISNANGPLQFGKSAAECIGIGVYGR